MKRLLVIDTSYLIYRSYFVFPRLSYNGVPTGALYGFVRAIMQMNDELKPDCIVFATDTKEKTWRHIEYEQYKATRTPPDPAMIEQIPLILEWARQISKDVFAYPGYEADDIIATVTKQYLINQNLSEVKKEEELFSGEEVERYKIYPDREVLIFSSDKDLYQMFTTPGIKFVRAKNKGGYELYGCQDFKKQYGLDASQWVDAKAIMGDNSDNLPGLSGVGPKTTTTILQEVGYLSNLYDVLGFDGKAFGNHLVTSQQKQKTQTFVENPKKSKLIQQFRDNHDQLKHIHKLATLSDVGYVDLRCSTPEFGTGLSILEKFAFRSLIQKTKEIAARTQQPEELF